MNPDVARGVLLIIAFAMVCSGVFLLWGLGWALLAGGALLIARVSVGYFAYGQRRGHSDG